MKTLKTLLIFSLVLLGFIAQCGLCLPGDEPSTHKFPVYVNNSAAADGDGSKDAPFQTLQRALLGISNSSFAAANNSYQILLAPTTASYFLDTISITSPKNLSLEISTNGSISSNTSSLNCPSYAQITFSPNFTGALFQSITLLKFSSVIIINPSKGESQMQVNDTDSFELSRVCVNITEANSSQTSRPAFVIGNSKTVVLQSTVFSRTTNFLSQPLFYVETADNLTLNNTEIWHTGTTKKETSKLYALLTVKDLKKVTVDNININYSRNSSYISGLNITNSTEVSITNVNLGLLSTDNSTTTVNNFKDLFICTNLVNLTMKDIQFSSISAVIDSRVFYLENIQSIGIQLVIFNNSQFRAPSSSTANLFAYVSKGNNQTNGSLSQDLFSLNSVDIRLTSFTKVGLLDLDSGNSAANKSFLMNSFSFYDSSLDSQRFLQIYAKKTSNSSDNKLSNFYIRNSKLRNAEFGYFEAGGNLTISNLTCENNIISSSAPSKYFFFEFKMDDTTQIAGFKLNENKFYNSTVLMVSKFPQQILIVNSSITANELWNSQIVVSEGRAQFTLVNSNVEITPLASNTEAFFITTTNLALTDSSVLLSGTSVANNMIVIYSDTVAIERTSFVHNMSFANKQSSVITIFKKPLGEDVLNISITQNLFNFSSSSTNQMIKLTSRSTSLSNVTIQVQDNMFESLANNSGGSWISFEMMNFTQSNALNNPLVLQDMLLGGNWIKFSNCSGEFLIERNQVLLYGKNRFVFVSIANSTSLRMKINAHTVNPSSVQSYFQLLNADSGNTEVSNFTLNDTTISAPVVVLRNNGLPIGLKLSNVTILNIRSLPADLKQLNSQVDISASGEPGGIILLKDDGAKPLANNVTISIEKCLFENITIEGQNGAINVVSQGNYNISLNSTDFRKLTSDQGAAISIRSSKSEINGSSSRSQVIKIDTCTFTDNYALQPGDAIYVEEADLSFSAVSFNNNLDKKARLPVFLVNMPDPVSAMNQLTSNSNLREIEIGLGPFKFGVKLSNLYDRSSVHFEATDQGVLVVKNVTGTEAQSTALSVKNALNRSITSYYSSAEFQATVTFKDQTSDSYKNASINTKCDESSCEIDDRNNVIGGFAGMQTTFRLHILPTCINCNQ